MKKLILIFLFSALFILYSADYVKILTPSNGWTTNRMVTVSGTTNVKTSEVLIVFNSIPLRLPIQDGRFSRDFVAGPGLNNIYAEVQTKTSLVTDSAAFYSKAPAKALKIVLMWDTNQTDLDLHVIEPSGEECFYGHKETKIGGTLDVDVTTRYGPEVYTLAAPTPGLYKIRVHYYSDNGNPQTQAVVYVVMNEGTPNEKIRKFETMLTQTNSDNYIDAVTLE
jgi:uncharacterized protein YfaP (DUF2135 family)